jgi:hypothetical protein
MPKAEAVRSQLPEFPAEGFDTPEAAMAHLQKLKEAAKALGKAQVGTEDRVNKPKRKVHPTSDVDPIMVMAEIHYYQRQGESWAEVLSTGKGERGVRNYNILIYCHNHTVDKACSTSCREVVPSD